MSPRVFWRLTFVLPPLVSLLLTALYSLVSGVIEWPESAAVLEMTWRRMTAIAVGGVTIGTWPAYLLWACAYLWITRNLSLARFRATIWAAPLTFAPITVVAWLLARASWEDPGPARAEAFAVLFGVAVVLGYVSIGVALAFEWLFRRAGWIKPSAPMAAA